MNPAAWFPVLSPWLWPSIYGLLCFLLAMGRSLSAFIFFPLGILFTVYSLWAIKPMFSTLVLGALHYDSLFFCGAMLLSLLFLVVGLMSYPQVKQAERWGLLLFLYLSALAIAAAGNLLVLFVALEMFFLLMVLWLAFFNHGQKLTGGTVRLFITGAFATGFTVFGMSFLYGVGGSLELADIGQWASRYPSFIYGFGLLFFLVGILFKLSAVPFHHWTAEVYEDSAYPALGMLAAISKTVGVIILLRIFYHLPIPTTILMVVAAATMTLGNLGALVQSKVKRLIAFSSISHVGFMLMGIASGNIEGFQAVATYLVYYTLVVLALVVLLMLLRSDHDKLDDYDGLAQRHPVIAIGLTFLLLALAGIPPTLGFMAKWKILEAAFQAHQMGLVMAAVLNSLIGGYYYLSWIFRFYMKQGGTAFYTSDRGTLLVLIALVLLCILVIFSFSPTLLFSLSHSFLTAIL